MTKAEEPKLRKGRRARRVHGLRFAALDAGWPAVRRRIAAQVAGLDLQDEREALAWNEAVSDFDSEDQS